MNPDLSDPDLVHSFTTATRLRVTRPDGARPTLLALTGELDCSENEKLRQAIIAVIHSHPGEEVALDATGLIFLDSGGVRALLLCREDALNAGSSLVIATAGPIPYQVLEITGLLEMFGMPLLVDSRLSLG